MNQYPPPLIPGSAKPRSVLLVHNRYQQPGGEDGVFEAEAALLERHGHRVTRLIFDNDDIPEQRSPLVALSLAASTVRSRSGIARVREAVRRLQPDVAHFHNTLPLVSPAAYAACQGEGVAVVQTLHNYRLFCPAATFFRAGSVCEDCLGRFVPWPSLVHGCYRDSRVQTSAVAAMLTVHRALRTWTRQVDVYVALTEFGRRKFIEGGLPANKIVVKPNFVEPDPGLGAGCGGFALFVGRLTAEKGIKTLLAAWESFAAPVPLKIVGDGPLAPAVATAAARDERIEWLGQLPAAEVASLMASAAILVFPSEWYEGHSRTVVEALAAGTPVVGASLGSTEDLIHEGVTGFLFDAGDPLSLATAVLRAWSDRWLLLQMRCNVRRLFEEAYTAEANYPRLIAIYELALAGNGRSTLVTS